MMREVDFGLIHAELDGGSSKQKVKLAISKSQVVNASSADDGVLSIKIANEITSATYAIQSKDLIINFADDHEILILKYLSQARVPSLVSDTGRFISRETIFTLTRFEQNTAATPAVAGKVLAIQGKAYVKRISGLKGEFAEGDDIYQGDYIATPRGSEVSIRLADGSEYNIGQEARVTIDKLAFSEKPDLHRSVVSVLQGELTYKSGDIARHPAGEAIINTPVAILTLKGEIAGGWQVDEEGVHKFFAECPVDSCNGKVEIKTLAGDRGLYQPNIFISVESMLKVPVQLTNLDNPKAMSMGEAVGAQPEAAIEEVASEEVKEEAFVAVEEPVTEEGVAPVQETASEGEVVVEANEVVHEEVKVEPAGNEIPVVDFFSSESAVIEVAAEDAKVEAVEEGTHELPQADQVVLAAEGDTAEEAANESVVASSVEEITQQVVEEEAAEEVVVQVAPVEEELIVSSDAAEEAVTPAEQHTIESNEAAEIHAEQKEEAAQNVIKLASSGELTQNGYKNGHSHLNGKNGHKVNGSAEEEYFYPEKFVEFKGIEYNKLKFEKSEDGEDLVIKVINGTPTTGHMIVLKGFFGHDSAQTSFEISQPGITTHKVN